MSRGVAAVASIPPDGISPDPAASPIDPAGISDPRRTFQCCSSCQRRLDAARRHRVLCRSVLTLLGGWRTAAHRLVCRFGGHRTFRGFGSHVFSRASRSREQVFIFSTATSIRPMASARPDHGVMEKNHVGVLRLQHSVTVSTSLFKVPRMRRSRPSRPRRFYSGVFFPHTRKRSPIHRSSSGS